MYQGQEAHGSTRNVLEPNLRKVLWPQHQVTGSIVGIMDEVSSCMTEDSITEKFNVATGIYNRHTLLDCNVSSGVVFSDTFGHYLNSKWSVAFEEVFVIYFLKADYC